MLEYVYFNVVQRDSDKLDRESSARGRSKSEMLTAIVKIVTNDFSDFSVADIKSNNPVPSPRYYQTYIRLTDEDRKKVAQAAAERYRKPAALIYAIVRLATHDFTDFSIIDNGKTAKKGTES